MVEYMPLSNFWPPNSTKKKATHISDTVSINESDSYLAGFLFEISFDRSLLLYIFIRMQGIVSKKALKIGWVFVIENRVTKVRKDTF